MSTSLHLRCSSNAPAIRAGFLGSASVLRESILSWAKSPAREQELTLFDKAGRARYHTVPAKQVIPTSEFGRVMRSLREWGISNLGCATVQDPALSIYLDECFQDWHQDSPAGPWSYVLSLTDWPEDNSYGGVTELASAGLSASVEALLPPLFNQLLVFDAQWMHRVQPVHGTCGLNEGRIVLHGMFGYPRPVRSRTLYWGPGELRAVDDVLTECEAELQSEATVPELLTVQLLLSNSGEVQSIWSLARNTFGNPDAAPSLQDNVEKFLIRRRWPKSAEGGSVIVPVTLCPRNFFCSNPLG
jgi:hypothetical protein